MVDTFLPNDKVSNLVVPKNLLHIPIQIKSIKILAILSEEIFTDRTSDTENLLNNFRQYLC